MSRHKSDQPGGDVDQVYVFILWEGYLQKPGNPYFDLRPCVRPCVRLIPTYVPVSLSVTPRGIVLISLSLSVTVPPGTVDGQTR